MAEAKKEGSKGPATIRKITVKSVHGKIDKKTLFALDEGSKMLVMRVGGVARRAKEVSTDFGDSVGFIGEFAAINTKGDKFVSSKLYLPKVLEEELDGIIKAGSEAEFLVDIYVVRDDDIAVGYFYEADSKLKPQNTAAAQRLFALVEKGAGSDVGLLEHSTGTEEVDTETGEIKDKAPAKKSSGKRK